MSYVNDVFGGIYMGLPYGPILINKHFTELNPLSIGTELQSVGWINRPPMNFYLIHYILRGEGTLITDSGTYDLKKNQLFIIKAGERATYKANPDSKFNYIWIEFDGSLAKKFDELPPVIKLKTDIFDRMLMSNNYTSAMEEYLTGLLFELYAELFYLNADENNHVAKVKNYIQLNYSSPLNVEDIAARIGLNRKYLSSIFKESTGVTVKQYIINVRMEYAKTLLRDGYSVTETSASVGYSDPFVFSKAFKNYYGISPREYKS